MREGAPLFEEIAKRRPEASDGAPAPLPVRQVTKRIPKDPVRTLAEAYGLAGETES